MYKRNIGLFLIQSYVFHVTFGKFYTWLNLFTEPAVVMVVTNIRCAKLVDNPFICPFGLNLSKSFASTSHQRHQESACLRYHHHHHGHHQHHDEDCYRKNKGRPPMKNNVYFRALPESGARGGGGELIWTMPESKHSFSWEVFPKG